MRRRLLPFILMPLSGCAIFSDKDKPKPPGPRPRVSAPAPLPVTKAAEDVVIAVWSEPAKLSEAGGQAQILVRLQKRGGAPYGGVQVRLSTSAGSLFSRGRVLVSDASGRTRDRLTTRESASITLNAGGTVYRFEVPVGATEP